MAQDNDGLMEAFQALEMGLAVEKSRTCAVM
jgi:hypothetical protein